MDQHFFQFLTHGLSLHDSESPHPVRQRRSRQSETRGRTVRSGYDALGLFENAKNVAALRLSMGLCHRGIGT